MLEVIAILMLGVALGVIIMNNREALEALKVDIAQEHSAVVSALVLLNGLTARLTDILAQHEDGTGLVSAIQDLRDSVQADAVTIANTVAQNTAAEGDSPDFPAPEQPPSDPGSPDTGSVPEPTPEDVAGVPNSGEGGEDSQPSDEALPENAGNGNVGGPDEASESIAEDGPSFTTTSGNTPEQVAENEAGSEAVDEDGESTS